jgi:hypothetical protein
MVQPPRACLAASVSSSALSFLKTALLSVLLCRLLLSDGGIGARSDSASLNPRRLRAQCFAQCRGERNRESERQHLPCRRVAEVENGQVEIDAERVPYIEAAASPEESCFEQRRDKARRHREYRQRLSVRPETS